MRRLSVLTAVMVGGMAAVAGTGLVYAQPVEVTITPPAELADVPVAWEALPIDIPDAAAEVTPVFADPPVSGAWVVALEPGQWQISGLAADAFLNTQVLVSVAGESFAVDRTAAAAAAFACPDQPVCTFADQAMQIGFDLPRGWAADQPRIDPALANSPTAEKPVTMVFFEDVSGDGGAAWFLNPVEWSGDLGPRRGVAGPALHL
ncbi:MAG: hypothetical protein R3D63_07915 [Paracoccaceae bacterium]